MYLMSVRVWVGNGSHASRQPTFQDIPLIAQVPKYSLPMSYECIQLIRRIIDERVLIKSSIRPWRIQIPRRCSIIA